MMNHFQLIILILIAIIILLWIQNKDKPQPIQQPATVQEITYAVSPWQVPFYFNRYDYSPYYNSNWGGGVGRHWGGGGGGRHWGSGGGGGRHWGGGGRH